MICYFIVYTAYNYVSDEVKNWQILSNHQIKTLINNTHYTVAALGVKYREEPKEPNAFEANRESGRVWEVELIMSNCITLDISGLSRV